MGGLKLLPKLSEESLNQIFDKVNSSEKQLTTEDPVTFISVVSKPCILICFVIGHSPVTHQLDMVNITFGL